MHSAQGVCQFADTLVITASCDNSANAVFENLFEMNHFADRLRRANLDDIETFVENHFCATLNFFKINIRVYSNSHFSTVSQNVNG